MKLGSLSGGPKISPPLSHTILVLVPAVSFSDSPASAASRVERHEASFHGASILFACPITFDYFSTTSSSLYVDCLSFSPSHLSLPPAFEDMPTTNPKHRGQCRFDRANRAFPSPLVGQQSPFGVACYQPSDRPRRRTQQVASPSVRDYENLCVSNDKSEKERESLGNSWLLNGSCAACCSFCNQFSILPSNVAPLLGLSQRTQVYPQNEFSGM